MSGFMLGLMKSLSATVKTKMTWRQIILLQEACFSSLELTTSLSYVKALSLLFSLDKVWSSKLNKFYPVLKMTVF